MATASRTSVAVFVCLDMAKSTRKGEKLRGGPRLASPTSTRLREEEQADFVSPTCSPEPMKRDASDPSERPNSKFMVPSQQPALTLVAFAPAEDPGSQLTTSAIASEDQVDQAACIKSVSTSIDKSVASSSSTASKYIYPHLSAPARGSLVRTTGELGSPPAANINPLKTDTASSSTAASPPGNPRGSDGPAGNVRESASGTRGFRTASVYEGTFCTTTALASMLKEVLGRTSRSQENLRGRDRSRLLETTSTLGEVLGGATIPASAPGGALGCCTSTLERNPRGSDGPSREEALARGSTLEEPRFSSSSFFLKQKPDPSSSRQAFRHTAPIKLSPSSARHVSHLGRASPNFPSLPHVPSGYSQSMSWADLVRADPVKAHDGYSLEMSSSIGGRSRIEGAVPAKRVEGQDATPGPVSVEHDFAGGEPEPSAEDFRDGLAEQDTAGGLEHQMKIDQFQAFISRLPMSERFRVLGLPEVHTVRLPVKTPSIRSAVELSKKNPGSGALSRGNFRSAAGGRPCNAASRKLSNLSPVKFHAPPVMTREE